MTISVLGLGRNSKISVQVVIRREILSYGLSMFSYTFYKQVHKHKTGLEVNLGQRWKI